MWTSYYHLKQVQTSVKIGKCLRFSTFMPWLCCHKCVSFLFWLIAASPRGISMTIPCTSHTSYVKIYTKVYPSKLRQRFVSRWNPGYGHKMEHIHTWRHFIVFAIKQYKRPMVLTEKHQFRKRSIKESTIWRQHSTDHYSKKPKCSVFSWFSALS